MLDQIILGTANFTQPYGILSKDNSLSSDVVTELLKKAITKGVSTLDTALGYGDLTTVIPCDILKQCQIITKISVFDSQEDLIKKMEVYKGLPLHGLLIHDPFNLKDLGEDREHSLKETLHLLQQRYHVKKIGVSAYDMRDIEYFSRIQKPDIIQIPLNPLNTSFDVPSFIEWAQKNDVEIHARSLFLQGILLSNTLPEKLSSLMNDWKIVRSILSMYPSSLHGLLLWAKSKSWVHHWVLGVASIQNFNDIVEASACEEAGNKVPIFPLSNHPLSDPRNW